MPTWKKPEQELKQLEKTQKSTNSYVEMLMNLHSLLNKEWKEVFASQEKQDFWKGL